MYNSYVPGQKYIQPLWEKCPSLPCHQGLTRGGHTWAPREEPPGVCPELGYGPGCRYWGRGRRGDRISGCPPGPSGEGSRTSR